MGKAFTSCGIAGPAAHEIGVDLKGAAFASSFRASRISSGWLGRDGEMACQEHPLVGQIAEHRTPAFVRVVKQPWRREANIPDQGRRVCPCRGCRK